MKKKSAWIAFKTLGLIISIVLIISYIGVLLRDFEKDVRREETRSLVSSMADLSAQAAEIVEERVSSALNTMEHASRLLSSRDDFQTEEVIERLGRTLLDVDTGLERFGIALPDGSSKVSNGESVNVSDRDFFTESMKGKTYVSSSMKSKLDDIDIFFLSVPVFDSQGEVKGVLYGVIETNQFKVYKSIELEKRSQNIYIIDIQGNYISQFMGTEAILNQNNFFSDIKEKKSSVPAKDVLKNMEQGASTYLEIKNKEESAYVYVSPSNIENWYIVTVVSEDVISDRVSHLQKHALDFITSITVLMMLFLAGYFLVISFEKRKTEKINQELRIRDSIFQIATAEMESFVFLYDAMKDKVDFMSENIETLELPRCMEHVSAEIVHYFSSANAKTMEGFVETVKKDLHDGKENSERELQIHKPEEELYYQIKMTHLYDAKKRPVRSIGMIYDVTEQKQKELLLRREEKLRNLFMTDTIAFYEIDIEDDIVIREYANRKKGAGKYSDVLEQFIEKRVLDQYQAYLRESCSLEYMKRCFQQQVYDYIVEYEYIRNNGSPYWVASELHLEEEKGIRKAFMTVRDIDSKKRRELHLEQQAVFDALTQVYNRSAGIRKISTALETMQPEDISAFLILDLDNFKQVNDCLGHMMGDQVLIEVARIMKTHFRNYDVICRLGGDEFIIFIQKIPLEALDKIVRSFLRKLVLTYSSEGKEVTVSASVGAALAPVHGTDFSQLYEKADSALYQVKNSSKNDYMLYKEK